jgi:PAS domain S-box-containing protein
MVSMPTARTAKIIFILMGVFWTLSLGVLSLDRVQGMRQDADDLAASEVNVHYKWMIIFRRWVAFHGGVYVPVTATTPPNPYLDVPERDITTTSGKALTLINPAYMVRLIYEMYGDESGTRGHITSLKPIRPANAPDEWERAALVAIERGEAKDVSEHVMSGGKPYLRVLKPLYVEAPCLKCHAKQGYKLGDVRGGISISISLDKFIARRDAEIKETLETHLYIWLLGICGIGVSDWLLIGYIRRREEAEVKLMETNESLRSVMDNASNAILALNAKGEIQFVNKAAELAGGYPADKVIGRRFSQLLADDDAKAEGEKVFRVCLDGESYKGFEARIARKDGQVRILLFNVSPILDPGGKVIRIVATADDITERKQAEEAEALKRRVTETDNRMQSTFIAGKKPSDVFNEILDILVEFTQSEFGYVAEYLKEDGGEPYLKTLAISAMTWSGEMKKLYEESRRSGLRFDNLDRIYGMPAKTGEFYISNDVPHDPLSVGVPQGHPKMMSLMGLPIYKGKELLAVLGLANRPGGYRQLIADGMAPLLSTCANILDAVRDERMEKRRQEELVGAKELAEEATKEKEMYVSLIAHDLKAPFTSTIGFLRLLAMDEGLQTKGKYGELMDATIHSAERAVSMIDEVLHISRFHMGGATIRKRFFDGFKAAFAVSANYHHVAAGKEVELVSEVAEGTRLYGDPVLFEEVLNNLVINAIKFTKKGDRITVFTPPGDQGAIAVKDTGVGIDEKYLPNIFRHDVKTSATGTAGETGTGLGLPLCQDIMKAHGGALTVESAQGRGSVFYARLPYRRPLALVADDDLAVRYMLGIHLRDIGVDVIEAENGNDAFKAIKDRNPDIAMLDIYMPGIDGFELLKRIRQDMKTSGMHVIIITSDNRLETREKVIRMGADDFIAKPVTQEEVIPRVRKFVG